VKSLDSINDEKDYIQYNNKANLQEKSKINGNTGFACTGSDQSVKQCTPIYGTTVLTKTKTKLNCTSQQQTKKH
jgi:hypothetical protein